jgi:Ca2+-binding RTX toxin-like protein
MSDTSDLYSVSALTTSDLVTPFDRYIDVYGLTLIAMPATGNTPATSDYFVTSVSNVLQEILSPSGADVVSSQQETVLTNFATINVGQLIGYGSPAAYSPSIVADDSNINYPGIDFTRDSNPSADFIWENAGYPETTATTNGNITEVLEHLLHTITEFGYTDAASTGAMNGRVASSDVRVAMQEAIDNGIFNTDDYAAQNDGSEDYHALLTREYLYLLTYSEWGFVDRYIDDSLAPEWTGITAADVAAQNPLGHALYQSYIAPTLSAPSVSVLDKIFNGKYLTEMADALTDGSAATAIYGRSGDDSLSGGGGSDLIYGNLGADRLVGGAGDDTLFGGQQADDTYGLDGHDAVYGNKQNDNVYGGLGNDSVYGGQQNDHVYGNEGDDRVDGNRGDDTLFGGNGADHFVLSKGSDVADDFTLGEDVIETSQAFSSLTQRIAGNDLILTAQSGDSLTLIGVNTALTTSDFSFI